MSGEAIRYFQNHSDLAGTFDLVIVNPPFVALDRQAEDIRRDVAAFMGQDASGRIDMYLAFLKMGLELLRPGGIGMFILPHSFLISDNAHGIRRKILQETWIRCLADLSAIRVFQQVDTYIVLLIFQKKSKHNLVHLRQWYSNVTTSLASP